MASNARAGRTGYRFRLAEDGQTQALLYGKKPPAAEALLEIARQNREVAAAYVRARNAGTKVVEDASEYTVAEALAIAMAVQKGEARLAGVVVYHPQSVTVRWFPTNGETPEQLLARYMARMKAAIKAQVTAMDASEYWNLTTEEYGAMCAKYGRYFHLLKEIKCQNSRLRNVMLSC